ncbi:Peptidyl-alpha-hydroxyglycine alpha-amidating lyase 1 [Dufourea novaeangliae]|uniref:peptidylamidoglycolate lyase n=1 Tax=Dufourea novaeangliae TaxID=178035 RepID=A0A154NX67_DUFNO|nr:Peptidyl-alpha-hydroxyglycine alpha-amidating lyase 1 [Dufourea novaeangliae]
MLSGWKGPEGPSEDVVWSQTLLKSTGSRDTSSLQGHRGSHRALHLPDKKFGFKEYSEYTDIDDRDKGSLTQQWDQVPLLYHNGRASQSAIDADTDSPNVFDKNIMWDSHWANNLRFGQISAVSIDPNGNIGIFHRGSRSWGVDTFDKSNRFNQNNGPIEENTVILLDKSGRKLFEWGANMFYLPHGLTIDSYGNYWITDVALHQVLKFDAKDIEKMKNMEKLRDRRYIPKPSLILGEAFEPGNDEQRFCKPTAVAVESNGDFFVSDGYCNSRIIKFDSKGTRILQWGRHWGGKESMYVQAPTPNAFFVPHALALASEFNLIFVADRENGRVSSFSVYNGTFQKQYKHPIIGTKIYSVAYAKEKLYVINGPETNSNNYVHVRGFVIDMHSGDVLSQFRPHHDMDMPHDIAVTEDGSEIYVVELNKQIVYRFLQDTNASVQTGKSVLKTNPRQEPAPLTDSNSNNSSSGGTTTATLVLSLVTAAVIFIALCVAIAAVVARCQKRGCLLIMRKRMRWEAERRENFKLSSLLEGRRGKSFKIFEKRPNPRDFSKLNTEPETSDDEHPENSLTRII